MIYPLIDAHIHMDHYKSSEQIQMIKDCEKWKIEALIAVSNDLSSAKETLRLAKEYPIIQPACGFHPEQSIASPQELEKLLNYIDTHHVQFIAIGEVGLPYYSKKKDPSISLEPYIELLEQMIKRAATYNKPIILHAIYEDAPTVFDLLEKHNVTRAHFHWFKGDNRTIERMISNGYCISITPDVLYEEEIKTIVKQYPLEQLMVETDGPWPFEEKFTGEMTHPWMIHDSVREIANIKNVPIEEVYDRTLETTKRLYDLT